MKHLDLTLPTPAEDLACDEALLDWCEEGHGEEVLRFWEPRQHFVVVGYANKVTSEVNVAACEAKGIPIHRRCSGGGTVLQGPGCLNYALVLRIDEGGPLRSISSANQFIMERNRQAIETLLPGSELRTPNSELQVRGHTDLAIGGRKFSGNSQRRRKRFLLFHGSFLLRADLALIGKLLFMPSKQPQYRQDRRHDEFLVNLCVPAAVVKASLRRAWHAVSESQLLPTEGIHRLVEQKYSTRAWNWQL